LEEALEAAQKCDALEREGLIGDCANNPWEQSVRLRPILELLAQPSFVAPAHFRQGMETCMACLLHAPEGCLRYPGRMVEFLDSPGAAQLLRYLEWLETAVQEVTPSFGGTSFRTILVPQRVRSALSSWPAECALLQHSATVLVEALLLRGPEHQKHYAELRKASHARQQIEDEQVSEYTGISMDLESAAADFADQIKQVLSMGIEWPQVARISELAVSNIQQLAADFLQIQEACCGPAVEEFEAQNARAAASKAAICEARRHVRRHEQAFAQAARRFTEVASQLVAWTSTLVPKLQLLSQHRDALRLAADVRQQVPALVREHLAAEDDLDTAQTELRKHRRHAQAAQMQRQGRSKHDSGISASAGAVLEKHFELRVAHTGERVQQLAVRLLDAQRSLREAEASLPLELDVEEDRASEAQAPNQGSVLTAEERLALKLASIEQYHEQVAIQVSEEKDERARISKQVSERRTEEALRRRVEPDFMCPITHERMGEPVLAADGHTYEREAIEKWLQMHNTSPMTGALLGHRYLTENYALRHIIQSSAAAGSQQQQQQQDSGDGGLSALAVEEQEETSEAEEDAHLMLEDEDEDEEDEDTEGEVDEDDEDDEEVEDENVGGVQPVERG